MYINFLTRHEILPFVALLKIILSHSSGINIEDQKSFAYSLPFEKGIPNLKLIETLSFLLLL